ncbi:hypothetical protein DFH28DRAFT_1133607 [Melampsora americana]|nr:hypothetical protein DFH28DRAFT_1133607 [Melampsora americana]
MKKQSKALMLSTLLRMDFITSEDDESKPIIGPGFGGRLMLTTGPSNGMMGPQHTGYAGQATGSGMMGPQFTGMPGMMGF